MKILGIKLNILLLIFLSAIYGAAEPRLVKDINPGGDSYPQYLTNVNGTLFFTADDGIHGWELWKSDGTTAGTLMVKDINPVGSSAIPDSDLVENPTR